MKRGGIILATLATLAVCVLTLSVISMPGKPSAPRSGPSGQQPFRMLVDTAPSVATSPSSARKSAAPESMQTAETVVTGPDGCVLLGPPRQLAFLPEAGLTLMSNRSGVHAFEAASGKLVWYRYADSASRPGTTVFGQRKALVCSGEELYLFEATTGREVWSQHNEPYGPALWALLSPDESRVIAGNDGHFTFYTVDTSERLALPCTSRSSVWGWFPDNKTVLVSEQPAEETQDTWKWRVVDFETGTTVLGWESHSDRVVISGLSVQGQLVDAPGNDEAEPTVRILDARTGNALREFKAPGPAAQFTWLHDGKRLVLLTADRQRAHVIDSETGAVMFSLSKEGYRFCAMPVSQSDAAGEWAISQDASNDWCAWPLTPDAEPRIILSGRGVARSSYYPTSAQSHVLMHWREDEHLTTDGVFDVEHVRMLAEWHVRSDASWEFPSMVNAGLTHLVKQHMRESPNLKGNGAENMLFAVYVRDKDTPIFEGQGIVMAVAPDGKHLAVEITGTTVSLYNVETGRLAGEYPECGYSVSFSGDGKRMALRSRGVVEVTDLVEGYPRRTMDTTMNDRLGWSLKLSPDGTRVLCGGDGGAWLFDADTGALLREFPESERFQRSYPAGRGFWSVLSRRAEDWIGTFSDRYLSAADVQVAFLEDGARVITHAFARVIRVWDPDSGKLLHTIHTGLPETRNKEGHIENQLVLSADGRFAFSINRDGYGIASLWSLADGTLVRQYQFDSQVVPRHYPIFAEDGSAIYIGKGDNLYRWPGLTPGTLHTEEGTAGN